MLQTLLSFDYQQVGWIIELAAGLALLLSSNHYDNLR